MENFALLKKALTYIFFCVFGGFASEFNKIKTRREFLIVLSVSIFIGINYFCLVQEKNWSDTYKMLGASFVGYIGLNGITILAKLILVKIGDVIKEFDLTKALINIIESLSKRN
ncbi:phage holin family protein [Desulfogranum japonicum]|uniref:phage holin family protein n=1 Tax=Desulfogranum japonicum TaxID=231447 RepID=UPI0004910EF5|nr:phage holin family protein [Desulfogranum japonicum]